MTTEKDTMTTQEREVATIFADLSIIFGQDMHAYCSSHGLKKCTTISLVGCVPLHSNLWSLFPMLEEAGQECYIPDWFNIKYDQREDYDAWIEDNNNKYYQR